MKRYRTPMNVLDRLEQSRKLPLGHVERKKADKAFKNEYYESRKIEKRFYKEILKKRIEYNIKLCDVPAFIMSIWEQFGCTRRVKVYRIHRYYPHCIGKNIYLYDPSNVITIAHELSHAIVYHESMHGTHNNDFLWVLEEVLKIIIRRKV